MEIFIDNYVQMRYNLFTLYKKYCIFCFMVISHKDSAADVLSDFSSDCLKIPQEYRHISRRFGARGRKICKQLWR